MPEIAEVEVLGRQLQTLVGATIVNIESEDPKIKGLENVRGRVLRTRRHGKLLGLELEDGRVLACHLRMTGALTFASQPHVRAVICFDDGHNLFFSDPRRFGVLTVVDSVDFGKNMGPDLLDDIGECTLRWQRTRSLHRPIKTVLLDQSIIAGIGNYMADETLFEAGIHPQAPSSVLSSEIWRNLCGRAYDVALRSLMLGGVSMRDYKHADGGVGSAQTQLRCYGRAGQPCLVCQTVLVHTQVGGRGTTFCPHCQIQRIRYLGESGETQTHLILPENNFYGQTQEHPRRQWLLTTYDVDAQAEAVFAVSDIGHWVPANR